MPRRIRPLNSNLAHPRSSLRALFTTKLSAILLAMNIYIDESGGFVPSGTPSSWNAVGAYVITERGRRGMEQILSRLKKAAGATDYEEIKLRHLDPNPLLYPWFLSELNRLDGVLYASVADAFLDATDAVKNHQARFVANIRLNEPRMKYEGGKEGMRILGNQVSELSPQQYAQLFHQTGLIDHVIRSAIIYFVQRFPATLRAFRWHIDRKDTKLTGYEDAFRKIVPMILQASSIQTPSMLLKGFDYGYLSEFWRPIPDYLKEDYGIELKQEKALDLMKIFRTDLQFLDSKKTPGLQIIDLLVSGVRRCMRGEFQNQNKKITQLLGGLMVQPMSGTPALKILTFSSEQELTGEGRKVVITMGRQARQMLVD
jgi:hypothetical protein